MPFSTFAELKTEIKNEVLRANSSAFTTALPAIVMLAETRIFYGADTPYKSTPVRVKQMQTRTDLTITNGEASIPADYLESVVLRWSGQPVTTPTYEPPATFHKARYAERSGSPVRYTVEAGKFLFSPTIASGTINLLYYAKPAALVADNDSNSVLTAYPAIYFNACLFEAYRHIRNTEKMTETFATYRSLLGGIQETDNKADTAGTLLHPRVPRSAVYR